MSLRLTSSVRLRARREFTAVDERGRRLSTRYFAIVGAPNHLPHDRLGIVASRRIGGAVLRNRAKRRLREVFRRQRPDEARAGGDQAMDIVVIARRDLINAPFSRLEAEFAAALKRLRAARPA
jgi:ribonuclease P protein component